MAAAADRLGGDVSDKVDVKGVQILNAEEVVNIFGDASNSQLHSDCDAQLLITVPVREALKLSGIAFRAASGGDASGPKTIKLFVNMPNLDFSEAESTKATHELALKATDLKGAVQELKLVKFQSVNSLTIFIVDNQAQSDKTCLSRITLFGSVQAGTNMKEFKAVG